MLLSLYIGSAFALTVPAGWSAEGPHRAVLDATTPDRAELREFLVGGGAGDPDELRLVLTAAGLAPASLNKDGEAYGLRIGDRVARARFKAANGAATWTVLIARLDVATTLDPDALLTVAMTPTAAAAAWGNNPVTAMGAGPDASGWGASGAAPAGTGWVDPAAVAWVQDPNLLGKWEASTLVKFSPVRFTVRFEGSGVIYITRKSSQGDQSYVGRWATRQGQMKLDAPGGGESLPYAIQGGALRFNYEGVALTFNKVP